MFIKFRRKTELVTKPTIRIRDQGAKALIEKKKNF
jgi:hypothetical protein